MRHIGRLGILTILFAAVLPAQPAQGEGAAARPSADEGTLLFQEIPSVYGASKYEQKVTEAPSSVSIVTGAEIKKYGYRTLGDILRSLRGFQTTYDRNYHYLGVRGFGPPGDYNSRILLLVDGHRINDNIYDTAPMGTDFPVDIDLIDRIEVIRGPSSSLYGTNAFFAVINVISKRGRDLGGPQVSGEAGSFSTYKGRLTYGDRFSSGFEALASGSIYRSEGDDELYFKEFDDPDTNNGVAEDSDSDRFGQLFGKLAYGDFTLEAFYNSREKEIPTAAWETFFNDDRNETTDGHTDIDLKFDHTFQDLSNLTLRTGYSRYGYDGTYVYDLLTKDETQGEWWAAEAQYTRKLLEKHRVSVGSELRRNFRQDQKNDDEEGTVNLDSQTDSTVWAVYAQDEFSILENLILNAGVRHDHYTTFGGSTNPRVALIYNPLEKTTLKALYGRAFRAPNAYELYYDDGGVTQKAPEDLDPETIDTYELVWEQYLGSRFRAVTALYYYRIKDLITQTQDDEGVLIFDNVDEIRAKGVEWELDGKLPGDLEGRLSYTYQLSHEVDSGQRLPNSPRHLAKANLLAPILGERLSAGVEFQYTSNRRNPPEKGGEVGGFAVTNLTLFSTGILDGLEASASVYNVFDKEYSDPGSGEHVQEGIEQDGRTFRVKATYTF